MRPRTWYAMMPVYGTNSSETSHRHSEIIVEYHFKFNVRIEKVKLRDCLRTVVTGSPCQVGLWENTQGVLTTACRVL